MLSARTTFELPLKELAEELPRMVRSTQPMWHPLGFVSATLLKHETGTLKIHLWPQGERRSKSPDWPIHDHSFHISSRVLIGSIGSIKYNVAAGITHRRYSVAYSGDDSTLQPTEELLSCVECDQSVMQAGTRYELPIGTYHENIVPTNELALTLVLKSGSIESPPNVIGSITIPDLPLYRRTPYPIDVLLALVNRIST